MSRYFDPLIVGGTTFDFPHLEPFMLVIPSVKANKDLRVWVRYTTHCFSVSHDPEVHLGGELILQDHAGRDRVFCPNRYRMSVHLPAILKRLEHPDTKVTQTAVIRNWVYTMRIEHPDGPYHVFFEVRRSGDNQQDLVMTIESAYLQGVDNQGPAVRGNMKFALLCTKMFLGEPVSTKR